MIKKLVSFSVEHPVSIICIILALFITGIFSSVFMNTDLLPQLSCRKLIVAAEYEGLSSEDMRLLVTIPLEDSFSSLKGLKNISSVTRDGNSIISLELHWGTDSDLALVECRQLIDAAYQILPSGCNKPVVRTDNGFADTISVAMICNDNDMLFARHTAQTDIKPRIQRLKGCGSVKIYGGEKEEISVKITQDKLISTGINLQDIASGISMANVEYPAGTITENDKDFIIKTCGLFESVEEIKKLPINYNENQIIPLENIASVFSGKKEKETFFLYNGKEAVRIGITKKNDASPITLSKDVKKLIQNLEDEYSPLFSFVILEDLSEQVTASLFSLILSGLIGIGVTFSVVLFFLKSFNIAFLLSSVIPLCAALCIATLNICGCTVNIMSLSGIAVGIGMVVDAGSVTLENLERKKSKYGILNKNQIVEAVMEIAMSNTGSAITSIIVFLPVFFLDGILGEVFFDMAVSIVCAISTSCILSLTYIPALYSVLPDKSLQKNKSDRFIRGVEKYYDRILGKILKKKYLAFIPFFICIITGLICLIFLDFELLPELKSGTYQITLDFPQGTQIKSMEKIAEKLSSELNVNNAIYGGMESDDYQRLSSVEERFESIVLTLKTDEINQNTMQIINQIASQNNASVKISEKQDMLSILLNTYKNKNIVSAKSVKELNKKIEGFNLQDVLPMEKAEEISFVPDRLFCSRLFTNPGYVASVIKNNLDGIKASDFYVKGRTIPIVVKLDGAEKFDSEAILDLNVKINNSNIPFGYLGKFTKQENEKVLFRYNRKDSKIIRNVTNDELEKISSENKIDYFNLAKIETEEMLSNGFFLLIICGLLLYFAMGCQFQSFLIPLLLLIAIPPAFSGAVIFLFIFNKTLNVYGVIALVILFGTSVNNSILLYENCIQIKSVRNNSILSACRKKIRGILVTNTTTIFALIPFAIDFSGKNSQVSMSICIIGGLIFSTIIVLTLIPIIFSVVLKGAENDR